MLEMLYDIIENQEGREEAKSVRDFLAAHTQSEDIEGDFLAAVRDSKFIGFREGVKVTLALLREAS